MPAAAADSPEVGLRKALVTLWRDDPVVAALIGARVFDEIPTGAAFPYVQLGEMQSIDQDVGCGRRIEVYQDVHVWSRATGFPETLNIMAALRRSLADAMDAGGVVLPDKEYLSFLVLGTISRSSSGTAR